MIPVRTHRRLDISILGMGCAQLGNLRSVLTDDEAEASVHAAWDAGIRYFDTAPHYGLGLSERRLGRALAVYPRDEYVLSTKVGRLLVPSPETAQLRDLDNLFDVPSDVRRVYDLSRDGVLRSIEASLDRLGLDRVDIVYMHDPDAHFEAARTTGAQTLSELRDEGVIGAYGAGMNQSGMLAALIEQTDADIVMCAGRLTLLEQADSLRMLRIARERGAAVVAAAVYNSGLLAGDSVPDRVTYDYADAPQDVVERARELERVCRAHGVTLPSAAVQYPLRMPQVVSAVVGMRGVQQVTEAVARTTASIPESLWTDLQDAGLIVSRESI